MARFPMVGMEYRYDFMYRIPNIIMIYFNLFCPFVIAYFVCKVIIFLGENDKEEEVFEEEVIEDEEANKEHLLLDGF